MGSYEMKNRPEGFLVYRFIKMHTRLIGNNDKCQNPKFKSNPNYQMSKILIGVSCFERNNSATKALSHEGKT